MQHLLQTLNISHVTTSYHPQSNSKVGRFHKTFNDVMSKKVKEHLDTWDLYINQVLAAISFNNNESTKFSTFYLLYNREPVMPVDNILKPRQKYMGEEPHKLHLEQQYKSFVLFHRHLKRTKKRQAKYADRNSKHTNFQVGEPYMLSNNSKKANFKEGGNHTIEL